MNLTELREAVRGQLDIEEEDLPTAMLDLYIREAFDQTVALEVRWPFLEAQWIVSATGSEFSLTLPSDVEGIASIADVTNPDSTFPLRPVPHDHAEAIYGSSEGRPFSYSVWGGELYVWPRSDGVRDYRVRGWRLPSDWVSEGAAAVPDCDVRLHSSLIHYACSRAYAQQEDEVLSGFYRQSWMQAVELARTAIMRPSFQGLQVMASGFRGA